MCYRHYNIKTHKASPPQRAQGKQKEPENASTRPPGFFYSPKTITPSKFDLLQTPYCILSYVAMREPMKVVTSRERTWQISSGTSQMVAPIFLAIEMLSLALR